MAGAQQPQAVEVSVVVPLFNEEATVCELFERLERVLNELGLSYELLFVDDGSSDGTRAILREIAAVRPRLRALLLARNFGQEPAVQAGMLHSRGRWVVQLDADLQNPPEEIPKLLARAREGYDVVYGRRVKRDDPRYRVFASKLLLAVARHLFGVTLPEDVSTFRVVDGELARSIAGMPERHKFFSALASFCGARSVSVEVRHARRQAGSSRYGCFALVNHSLDLLIGFSFRPLRVIGGVGTAFATVGMAYAAFKVLQKLAGADIQLGYTSLFGAIVIMGGLNLIALGVVGEYVGRIFLQTQGRPIFRVAEELGAEAPRTRSPRPSFGADDLVGHGPH